MKNILDIAGSIASITALAITLAHPSAFNLAPEGSYDSATSQFLFSIILAASALYSFTYFGMTVTFNKKGNPWNIVFFISAAGGIYTYLLLNALSTFMEVRALSNASSMQLYAAIIFSTAIGIYWIISSIRFETGILYSGRWKHTMLDPPWISIGVSWLIGVAIGVYVQCVAPYGG